MPLLSASILASVAWGALVAHTLNAVSQQPTSAPPESVSFYDADPDHAWNRVHAALFRRRGPDGVDYGLDALDPYLFASSKWLFSEPRLSEALEALEEFLDPERASSVRDPLRRLVFQRDLWAVFDWLAERRPGAQRVRLLRARIARAMRAVALSDEELAGIVDNGALAAASGARPAWPGNEGTEESFLPTDLFEAEGSWVTVRDELDPRLGPLALVHAHHTSGRSTHAVHLRLPGGREATLEYLARLAAHANERDCDGELCSSGTGHHRHLALDVPQPPPDTAFALVRRALAITRDGRVVGTPLVESVQVRVLRSTSVPESGSIFEAASWRALQHLSELRLSRHALFTGVAGGLVPLDQDEPHFNTFGGHGLDPFERKLEDFSSEPLGTSLCLACHAAPGILSMNAFTRVMSGPGTLATAALQRAPSRLVPATRRWLEIETAQWKSERYDWGLFVGLHERADR